MMYNRKGTNIILCFTLLWLKTILQSNEDVMCINMLVKIGCLDNARLSGGGELSL